MMTTNADSVPFLGADADDHRPLSEKRIVILPLPFERTTSYGSGTARGPMAIIEASQFVELYDEELRSEPFRQGVETLAPFDPGLEDLGDALRQVQAEAQRHIEAGKFVVALGGEHSLTAPLVRAARDGLSLGPDQLGVVQFDAHADLRTSYEGTPHSHAAVMHRVLDDGFSTFAIGIRSLSIEEARLIDERNLPILWASELQDTERALERFEEMLTLLPEQVYLTFDIDFFDPTLIPATGTPEPGGGIWWPTLAMLRLLFRRKKVVAMDLVELAPMANHHASDFLAAKLVYKCLGYLAETS